MFETNNLKKFDSGTHPNVVRVCHKDDNRPLPSIFASVSKRVSAHNLLYGNEIYQIKVTPIC